MHVKPNLPVLGQKFGNDMNAVRKALESANPSDILASLDKGEDCTISAEDKDFSIERNDILIEYESAEGFASARDGGLAVGLITELDESLIQEGIVRDVIRQVQIFTERQMVRSVLRLKHLKHIL